MRKKDLIPIACVVTLFLSVVIIYFSIFHTSLDKFPKFPNKVENTPGGEVIMWKGPGLR
jgi:hypothetical protein